MSAASGMSNLSLGLGPAVAAKLASVSSLSLDLGPAAVAKVVSVSSAFSLSESVFGTVGLASSTWA